MNSLLEMLEVVDKDDKVISFETREKIHREGLLHREIHIFFITPNNEIIFQHRSKNKDTYPDKLDATVGGHVEPNMSYEETAIKEAKEETGIDIDVKKLIFLIKMSRQSFDEKTKKINNTIRSQYAYPYEGKLEDLKIEKDKAECFETYNIDGLSNLSEKEKSKFIPLFLDEGMIKLYKKAKEILYKNL